MKSIIVIVAIVALVLCLGFGLGLGGGIGDGEGDGNSKVEITQDETPKSENDVVQTETNEIENSENVETSETESEEDVDTYKEEILRVNVVENDYFYENERISIEDFSLKVEAIDSIVTVEVKDDNASLNAYNTLIDLLEEENISYVEK